jgi:hypothetical protein
MRPQVKEVLYELDTLVQDEARRPWPTALYLKLNSVYTETVPFGA